jgi:glycosyltransferase involved in cell wall biosynthesis
LGNGNLPKEWKSEKIIEHGLVSREEVLSIMQSSHLHIITSLAETNPTVLWEAMSWAVPTMTLDHCGMSAVVCERCGIKIQIHSYRQVINDIRNQIDDICRHPERIRMMSEGVIECSKKFMWENRINLFNSIYNELVKRN